MHRQLFGFLTVLTAMLVLPLNFPFHNGMLPAVSISLAAPQSSTPMTPSTPLPPLAPNPVYPGNGLANTPSNFTLRWNSGLDASRTNPQWPVTYAIYYKSWANGGIEPANYSIFGGGFVCNPDSSGVCTKQVSGMGAGNYRWYVVANMDISAYTGVANSVLSTQSAAALFSTGNIPVSMISAPLPPNPVYPDDGLLNVPSSFNVRWSDGLDASRTNPRWPVTYAIHYKSWPIGGVEPADYTLFSDGLPCNPDSTGVCTMAVSGISAGNYRWYVVANMDVSASTGIANSILSTQGSAAFFSEAAQPLPPVQSPPNRILPVQIQPSAQIQNPEDVTIDVTEDAPTPAPAWMVYRVFFLHLAHLDQLADQDNANGNVEGANGWRAFEQQAAGLTEGETQLLKQVAYSCNDQLKVLGAALQTQITSFRAQYPNGQFLTVPVPQEVIQSFQQNVTTINSCIDQLSAGLGAASFQKLDSYIQTRFQTGQNIPIPGPTPSPTPVPISSTAVNPPPPDPPTNEITVNDVPSVGMYSFVTLNVTSHGVEGSIECSANPDGTTLANYDVVETECHLFANGLDVASTVPCFTDSVFPFTFCQGSFIPVTGVSYAAVGYHNMNMLKVQPPNNTSSCYWADPLRYGISNPPILDEQGTVFAGRGPNSCWGDTNGSLLGLATTVSRQSTVILINPAQATLFQGDTQQFSANIPVTWTLRQGPGAINIVGSTVTYQAPATIDTQQKAILEACNTSSISNCATATITLLPVTLTVTNNLTQELIVGEQAQLTVTFNPSSFDPTKAVEWKATPDLGGVNASNVYSPPSNSLIPAGGATVTLTAKSKKNASVTGNTTVRLAHIDSIQVIPVSPVILSGQTTSLVAQAVPSLPGSHEVTWPNPAAGSITTVIPNGAIYTAPAVTKETPVKIQACMGTGLVCGETTITVTLPLAIASVTPQTWNSGEIVPITITGTGFGTQPQIDFGDPTIFYTPNPAQPNTDTSISGTVTVPFLTLGKSITVSVTNPTSPVVQPPAQVNVNIAPVAITVALSPASASVPVGQSATFAPNVTCKTAGNKACPGPIAQVVNCVLKPQVGSVSSGAACVYTAAPPVSTQQSVQITACSALVPVPCNPAPNCLSQTCGTATVTVTPVNVTVTPKNITLFGGQVKAFNVTVTNNPNTLVTWSIVADPLAPPNTNAGFIDPASGNYTAPNPITVQQAIKIRACSNADHSRCDDAPVTLMPLVVTPGIVTLKASNTQTFSAATNGVATLVDWSLDPNVPAAGSITTLGVYTAPSSLSTVIRATVIATSKADGSKGTATVFLAAACYPRCRAVRHTSAAVVGQAYSGSVLDPTLDTPQGFIYAGNLPPNLNFATNTGAITGVPVQPPTIYGFSATPFYADGDGGTEVYALPVCQSTSAPPITAGPFVINNSYSIAYVPGINPGGMFNYSATGTLPQGMSLDPSTGIVSGAPSAEGTYTYTIHTSLLPGVSANTAACPAGTSSDASYQVTVSCDASCRVASLTPTSLAFGGQSIATTSSTQTITLLNSGSGTMSISSISASGDFGQTNNCGSSLASGAGCSINVSFTPTVTGTRTGTLSISDNAAGSPHTASLSGTGLAPSLTFAWIQPSGVTWGPANTLTTAGFATGGAGNVALRWRDATLNGPWNSVPFEAPPNSSNGGWSNTIPSADNCHAFQATVTYTGVTAGRDYDGVALGYCSFRVIWIQPQYTAGFGPVGSLVVAGSAQGGPPNAQVTLWFRDDTVGSSWTPLSYAPIPDATGIWYNAIENVNFSHQYSVYITYDDRSSGGCSYLGNGTANNCP
jgi:hypothetical protein